MSKITQYIISPWQEQNGDFLVKSFSLSESGELVKNQPGIIYSGHAILAEVTLEQLSSGIKRLDRCSCIGLGNCGQEKVKVTTKKNDGVDGKLARTKDNFKYRKGEPAFVYFDMDSVQESPESALSILSDVIPGLSEAGKLIVYSSSAGIKTVDGKMLSDSTSAHIYVEIADGTDAVRFIDTVFDRLALAGKGKIQLSAAPSFLRRGIIDQAVSGPERLVYEGSPILSDGLIQEKPDHVLIPGGILNSAKTKSLTTPEKEKLKKVWQSLKVEAVPALEEAISKKVQHLVTSRSISNDKAQQIVKQNQEGQIESSLVLHFAEHGEVLARELLDDGKKFNFCTCADPLDPGYDGSSLTKAKFFWNSGDRPCIYSQAHGGIKYDFVDVEEKKEALKAENELNQNHDLDATIARYNKKFAAVMLSGAFAVMSESRSMSFEGTEQEFWKKGAFLDYYCNDQIWLEDANGTSKPHSVPKLWLGHSSRRSYQGVVFDPSEKKYPDNRYNMFSGWNLAPKDGNCEAVLNMMRMDICNDNPELFDYICAWFQQILKTPWKKTKTALIFSSGQGCGKGLFMKFVSKMFAGYYLHILDGNLLVGRFNDLLQGKLVVFADEAVFAGDPKAANKLKGLITEDSMTIEIKNISAYPIDSYVNLVIASNDRHVATLDADDRRYVVCELSEEHKNDWDYFEPVWKELRGDGTAALMKWLLDQDFSNVELGKIPTTDAREEQKQRSLTSVQAFWLYVLDRGYLLTPNRNGEADMVTETIRTDNSGAVIYDGAFEWPNGVIIRKSFVYDEYLLYCKNSSERYPASLISFWHETRRRGSGRAIFRKSFHLVRSARGRMVRVPPLEIAKDDFCDSVCLVEWGSDDIKNTVPAVPF